MRSASFLPLGGVYIIWSNIIFNHDGCSNAFFRISSALNSIDVLLGGSLWTISETNSTFLLSMIILASLNCMKMALQYSQKKLSQLIIAKNVMLIQNDHGWH